MRKFIMLIAALACSAAAQAAPLKVVNKDSEIAFTFKQENVPMKGGFSRYSGTLSLDEKKPEASSVQMLIDTGSITAGSADADAEVVKPEWFNVIKFPQARFDGKTMKFLGAGKWQASGPLSIKGTTRDAVVPFTAKTLADGRTELSGEFLIKRGDYKLGEGEWSAFDTVANEVTVKFRVLFAP